MPTDGCSEDEQGDAYINVLTNEEGAIEKGCPNQSNGYDFGTQGYGFMLAEIADVGAQILLVNEPIVQIFGTSDI